LLSGVAVCCDVGMDCVASRRFDVDIGRIEADFQRKSHLIQTKTAVLNDKEHKLRLLEHQLATRELAILWQERRVDVNSTSKHTSAHSPSESGSYWQRRENPNKQQVEKYGDQWTKEEPHIQHHYSSAVFDHNQHVRPPDGDVPTSASGLAMEKLEEQFARLVHTRPSDILSQRADVDRTQQPSKIRQRPETVLCYPVSRHCSTANNQASLMHKYANVVRKRGRPRGSRSRYTMKVPSEPAMTIGMPVHPQWMNNLYMQIFKNSAVATSAAGRHGLAPQTTVNCRLPVRAGMMVDSGQNAVEIVTSGQPLPNQQLTPFCLSVEESSPSMCPARSNPQSAMSPAVTPCRVRQLLASAASTTGASILPPLSPILTAEFSTSVAEDVGHSDIPQDLVQRGRSSGDDGTRKDVACRLVDSTPIASEHAVSGHCGAARSEEATLVDVRCAASHPKHLSDKAALSARVTVTDCRSEAVALQSCRETTNHILPKVSSFDAGHCWNSRQAEQEYMESDHMTIGTAECCDDDDDQRLVVVIESD